jgi:hypothetical protein
MCCVFRKYNTDYTLAAQAQDERAPDAQSPYLYLHLRIAHQPSAAQRSMTWVSSIACHCRPY